MRIAIRPAAPDDGDALREIERLAGERFREIGLATIADDDPPLFDTLARYATAGRSWVAVDDTAAPVGYVLVDIVDDCAHIEQISVRPDHQGRGVGRQLLGHVRDWATGAGRRAVTLTTFSDVPWNRPLYEHLGFRVLAETEIGPELRAVREAEVAHGLDPATRVCMYLELASPSLTRAVARGRSGPNHSGREDEAQADSLETKTVPDSGSLQLSRVGPVRTAVEQVIQTVTRVLAGELTAQEAFTILVTLTREAVPAARELCATDPDRAAKYRELIVAVGRELRRREVGNDEARYLHAVIDDLAKVLRALE